MRRFLAHFLALPCLCLAGCENALSPGDAVDETLAALRPGDVLLVGRGVYEEQWTISGLRGTPDAPITIRGQSGAVIRPAGGRDGILILGNSEHLVIEGLAIENAPRAGIIVNNSRHVTIRDCRIAGNRVWGVQTVLSDFITVEGCDISGSREQHGVYFSTTDHPVVRKCRIYENAACGIHMNADPGEGGDGMITGGTISGNRIHGNGRRGGAAINMDGVEYTVVEQNRIYDNAAGGIAVFHGDGLRTGAGNRIAGNDVRFASGSGRYALQLIGGAADTVVEKNVLVCNRGPALETDGQSLAGLRSDRNVFYAYGASGVISVDGQRLTLDQWRARTGQDANSAVRAPTVFD